MTEGGGLNLRCVSDCRLILAEFSSLLLFFLWLNGGSLNWLPLFYLLCVVNSYRMRMIALDLEMNQPSRKIIQIGAVVGDVKSGEIIERFSRFVNPGEELNPEIIQLTGITQRDVDSGVYLPKAYSDLVGLMERTGAFCNPVTWGGSDAAVLKEQLDGAYNKWVFGHRWIDAKTIYQSYCVANDKPLQGGLAKVVAKFGLRFSGRKHNALSDAENTFALYRELLKLLSTSNPK